MGEHASLARPGPGDDEQGSARVLDRLPLHGVEPGEQVVRGRTHEEISGDFSGTHDTLSLPDRCDTNRHRSCDGRPLHVSVDLTRTGWGRALFPLNRAGGFGGDVEGDAVDAG